MPGQAGGSRFNEMARLWADRGHEVTVIAGNLDCASGEVPPEYRGWVTREQDGKVCVLRCSVPSAYVRGYRGRAWAFSVFMLLAAAAATRVRKPDVVIASSPPLTIAIPGWFAARARMRRCPWIFEIRDLWPESAVTTGVLRPTSRLTKLLYALERWACAKASVINVLTPAFRDDLTARGLAAEDRIWLIPNGADTSKFLPSGRDNSIRREFGWGDRFVALYAGAHGRANAVGQLVDAARHLSGRNDILLASVGGGPEFEQLRSAAAAAGLSNIEFRPPVAKDRMPELVNACDAGLAVLQNNPTFRTVYPNKVFDYMACARPVVLAIDGVAKDLVCTQARAGFFAIPEDGADIAAKIQRLADNPAESSTLGANGRAWVVKHASREALASEYLEAMQGLTKRK